MKRERRPYRGGKIHERALVALIAEVPEPAGKNLPELTDASPCGIATPAEGAGK